MALVQDGTKPLPRCDQCGMKIHVDMLCKHRKMDKCNKVTERRRDVDLAKRCDDMEFSLYGRMSGKLQVSGATPRPNRR